ncbi:hypothetical protein N5863_29055 (plasmid) [Klebsiella pasteurii]|uniref:hypothetical protein n=1 Tax=Klebsiella pasteurii TaxID=2587529 RepID=UPI002542E2AE|nr:hypothetical protein [Klebsiella pasteurii]WII85144.1 hypothetical protein N5863_29055 [Klebsiella pasteurii]
MNKKTSDLEMKEFAHRVSLGHAKRLNNFYGQLLKSSLGVRLSFKSQWVMYAMFFIPLSYVMPAKAAIGNANDVTVGLAQCINDGRLGTLDSSPGMWGGECDITLTPGSFTPSQTVTGNENQSINNVALLNWVNAPIGYDVSLQISNDLVITCNNSRKFIWRSGTVFKLNTITPLTSYDNVSLKCAYYTSAPPKFPIDLKLSTNNISYSGSVGGILKFKIAVPVGTPLKFPALNLTFDTSVPAKATMISIAVGGSGGVDPTPPNPPVAGDPPNCTAINGVNSTTYDFGGADPSSSAVVLNTSAKVSPHNLTLSCTSGKGGSIKANATMYVQTSSSLSSDRLSLLDSTKPGDWLGLQLAFPPVMPLGVIKSIEQNNTVVTWTAGKAVPLWTWSIPASGAQSVITLPVVSIQPQIKQLVATPTVIEGSRTYNVTYSALIQ